MAPIRDCTPAVVPTPIAPVQLAFASLLPFASTVNPSVASTFGITGVELLMNSSDSTDEDGVVIGRVMNSLAGDVIGNVVNSEVVLVAGKVIISGKGVVG